MICFWKNEAGKKPLSLEQMMTIHEIRNNHVVLYENEEFMIVENRYPGPLCDHWDCDVVVFDMRLLAKVGAANRIADGHYKGFVVDGVKKFGLEGDSLETLGWNALCALETVDAPDINVYSVGYKRMQDTVRASGLDPYRDQFNVEMAWCFPNTEVEEGSGIVFDGLGVLISCYLVEVNAKDPMVVHLRVVKWYQPNDRLGPNLPREVFSRPVFDGLRARIDLRTACPKDFRPHDYDFVYFWTTIVARWSSFGSANEFLRNVGSDTIRKNIYSVLNLSNNPGCPNA